MATRVVKPKMRVQRTCKTNKWWGMGLLTREVVWEVEVERRKRVRRRGMKRMVEAEK